MKAISFILANGTQSRAYVLKQSDLMPMLHDQGLIGETDFIIKVDWSNTGDFRPVFTRKMHTVCPFCGTANDIEVQELGFEEFECGYCDSTYQIPDTPEEIAQFNLDSIESCMSCPPPSHYRVMCIGEDGMLFCLKNGVPAEWAELVLAGYQAMYTEGQKCFLEPEETLADLRAMCDSY